MTELSVDKKGAKYSIVVKDGLMKEVGLNLKAIFSKVKVLVVSDGNVSGIYGEMVRNDLINAGFEAYEFIVQSGDESMTTSVLVSATEYLSKMKFTKSDVILSLGGRTVINIAGFVAALYQGGMNYVQVPTTLVSFINSSFDAAKTINLKSRRNFIQTTYLPAVVYIDLSVLETRGADKYVSGFAEIIKYALFCDKGLFAYLEEKDFESNLDNVLETVLKARINFQSVEDMEYNRVLYNAVMELSGGVMRDCDAISAVLLLVTNMAVQNKMCVEEVLVRLTNLLKRLGLPSVLPYTPAQLKPVILTDKVMKRGSLDLFFPSGIGEYHADKLSVDKYDEWFLSSVENATEN